MMPSLGYMVITFGVYVLFSSTIGARQTGSHSFWPGVFVAGIILVAGESIRHPGMEREQEGLDANAANQFHNPSSPRPFSLYLRAFKKDGLFTWQRTPNNFFDMDYYDRPDIDSYERVLSDAVRKSAPLIGFGNRGGMQFGFGSAGRINLWQDQITTALQRASLVFVLPATSDGTLWEIGEIIRGGHLGKTVFLLPPLQQPEARDEWAQVRETLSHQYGLLIPPCQDGPGIFAMKSLDEKMTFEPVQFEPRKLAVSINRLMQS